MIFRRGLNEGIVEQMVGVDITSGTLTKRIGGLWFGRHAGTRYPVHPLLPIGSEFQQRLAGSASYIVALPAIFWMDEEF